MSLTADGGHWLRDGDQPIAAFFGPDKERWPRRVLAWQQIAEAAQRVHECLDVESLATVGATDVQLDALADLLAAVGDLRAIDARITRAEGSTP